MNAYTAEVYAMLKALEWSKQVRCRNILRCNDSVSDIKNIKTDTARNHQHLLHEILFVNSRKDRQGREVSCSAHSSILGNERAEDLGKESVTKGTGEKSIINNDQNQSESLVWRDVNQQ